MIGLIDPSFTWHNKKAEVPNLEIMKLATYYRLEEKEPCHLILPGESTAGYDKIYCYSEFSNEVPQEVRAAKNIIYGGPAFTGGAYVPFENFKIDFTQPRTTIYNDYFKQCNFTPEKIMKILDGIYYRMYAGEEKLPTTTITSGNRVYIYDANIFVKDWQDIVGYLESKKPSSIRTIHPITCTTMSQYMALRNFAKLSRGNDVYLNLPVKKEEYGFFFKEYERYLLGDILKSTAVYIPFGGEKLTYTDYYKDLIKALNILYSYWARGIPIKLKYIRPSFHRLTKINDLSIFIERWSSLSNDNDLNRSIKDKFYKTPRPEKLQYEEMIRWYPGSKNLFIQNFNALRAKKYWRW